jgi:hypothetical protein
VLLTPFFNLVNHSVIVELLRQDVSLKYGLFGFIKSDLLISLYKLSDKILVDNVLRHYLIHDDLV